MQTRPSQSSDGRPAGDEGARGAIRVAAAGDLHCREGNRAEVESAFGRLKGKADLALIAGDVTIHGDPAEAAVLADACRSLDMPVVAVLGNHDFHAGRDREIADTLAAAGITVLDRDHTVCLLDGEKVGIAGTKGFVGGFPGSHLPDFGEPTLRAVYAEASAEVEALERGLREIALCPLRIVLLHYAPTATTLEGEPPGIWAFLGTDRMAGPILEHEPDLVLHGHAHLGRFEGRIGEVPVFNVSVPVMERDFWVFELGAERPVATPIH